MMSTEQQQGVAQQYMDEIKYRLERTHGDVPRALCDMELHSARALHSRMSIKARRVLAAGQGLYDALEGSPDIIAESPTARELEMLRAFCERLGLDVEGEDENPKPLSENDVQAMFNAKDEWDGHS